MILNGRQITGRTELHDALKAAFSLPAHYGRNLDALNDCLSGLKEKGEVRIECYDEMRRALGGYADRLVMVLEKNGFQVSCVDESGRLVYNDADT